MIKYFDIEKTLNAINPNEYIFVVVDKFGFSRIDFSRTIKYNDECCCGIISKIKNFFSKKKSEKEEIIYCSRPEGFRDSFIESIIGIMPSGADFACRCLGYGDDGSYNGYDYGCVENTYKLFPHNLEVKYEGRTTKIANVDEVNTFCDFLIASLPDNMKHRIEKHEILYSGLAKDIPGLPKYGEGEEFETFQQAFNYNLKNNKRFGLNLKEPLNLHGNKKRFGIEIHTKINPSVVFAMESDK